MVSNGQILIADDEDVFLESTADLLRIKGYECDTAPDAHRAADLLGRQRYDLMISDIKMPGNDGLALIKQAREIAQGMSVILVTGNPTVDTAIDSVGLPVSAYLLKPVDVDELLSKVEECVRHSRILDNIRASREHLAAWHEDLKAAESLLQQSKEGFSDEPIGSFVSMNLKNVADALVRFGSLTEELAKGRSDSEKWEMVATAQLDTAHGALIEAIGVLEETKSLFKSKKLAQLRRKLQTVVDGWKKEGERENSADSLTL